MVYKKSLILTCVNGSDKKAVVTLESGAGEIVGTVRLYNFNEEPQGILSLGFLNDGKVVKSGLTKTSDDVYSFKISENTNLNDFTCALVRLSQGEAVPLLVGSTNKMVNSEERLCNSLSIFDEDVNVNKIKQTLDENEVFLEEQEEIDKLVDAEVQKAGCDAKCVDCKYRDAFFKLDDDTTPPPKEDEPTFYDEIKEQIQDLFGKYPEEDILKDIIPNSKWVKIDYEEKGEYYVVGMLYENDKIKYVCYGVPSMFEAGPPDDLKGFSQWLPLDGEKPEGFGYWITYQDAETGENVKLDYETV